MPPDEETARVALRPLVYRRRGELWTVGCAEVGEAVDMPEIAVTVLRELSPGATMAQAARAAHRAHGVHPDVQDFVADLMDLGFAASVIEGEDATTRAASVPATSSSSAAATAGSSLPWLSQRAARALFHPATLGGAAVFVVLAFVRVIAAHRLNPGYEGYFAFRYPGLSAAWSLAAGLVCVAVHEFCHLAAARAEGIAARMSLSTRLVMITPQTSAPLLWLVDRRARIRFHLAGMGSDLVFAALCATVLSAARPGTAPSTMAGSALLMLLFAVAGQFVFCIRTDMYLVVQDLLRCRNLYADALDYAGHLAWRARVLRPLSRWWPGVAQRPDPSLALPIHERRPVRCYAIFLVFGCAVVLAETFGYALPIEISLATRSIAGIASGDVPRILDGLVVVGVEIGSQVLLIRLLIRGRRARSADRDRQVRSAMTSLPKARPAPAPESGSAPESESGSAPESASKSKSKSKSAPPYAPVSSALATAPTTPETPALMTTATPNSRPNSSA